MKPTQLKKDYQGRRAKSWVPALAAIVRWLVVVQSKAATVYTSQTSTNPSPPYATWDTAAHSIQDGVGVSSDGDTVLVAPRGTT